MRLPLGVVAAAWALLMGWMRASSGLSLFDRSLHNDFAHYRITSQLLREGVVPYTTPLAPLYSQYGFVNDPPIAVATNPPLLAALFMPSLWMSPQLAFVLWTGMQLLSLLFVFRSFGITFKAKSLLSAFSITCAVILSGPFFAHLYYGQTQLLIAAVITAGLRQIELGGNKRIAVGCALWGFTVGLKIFTAPLAFVALGYGGILGLVSFAAGALIPNLAVEEVFGTAVFSGFVSTALPYITQCAMSYSANIALPAIVFRTFGNGQEWMFATISACSSVAMIFLVFVKSRAKDDVAVSTAVTITAVTLLSPVAWTHYLVLLLIPFGVIFTRWDTLNGAGRWIAALCALLVLSAAPLGAFGFPPLNALSLLRTPLILFGLPFVLFRLHPRQFIPDVPKASI